MQTGIQVRGNPEVKREMWQRGRHQPYVAPDLFTVSERVGSGGHSPKLGYVTKIQAVLFMSDRAVEYLNLGYAVTWHDNQSWFIATHETEPTVFCVLTEAE